MTKTEERYTQIEKEALAITWACDKFSNYIVGTKIQIKTDHKPLISLLGSKRLDDLPPREEAEFFMNITVNSLPATSRKLIEYINAQRTDVVCSKVCSFVQQGWPDKHKIEPSLKLYRKEREL